MFRRTTIRFALLAIALTCGFAVDAQPVFLPNSGTTGPCNVIPWGASYYSGEGRYQVLVPRAALVAAGISGPAAILNVAFLPCATTQSTTITANFTVRIGHTVRSDLGVVFDDNYSSDATNVFAASSYSFTPAAWSDVSPAPFASPFQYNGVDNVVIEITLNTAIGGLDGFVRTTGMTRAAAMGPGASTQPTAMLVDDAALRMRLTMAPVPPRGAPATGDLIVAAQALNQGGIFAVSSTTTLSVQPILTSPVDVPNAIVPDRDNTGAIVGYDNTSLASFLTRFSFTSKVTPLCRAIPGFGVQGVEQDYSVDSEWVFTASNGQDSFLSRIDTAGNCSTILQGRGEIFNDVCLDPTGAYVVANFAGRLRLFERDGTPLRDITASVLSSISSVSYHHRTDEFLVTQFAQPNFLAVSPSGLVRTLVQSFPGANAHRAWRNAPGLGGAWIAGGTRFAAVDIQTGAIVRAFAAPPVGSVRDFYVDGDNLLSVHADSSSGNRVEFAIRAGQKQAGKAYVVLLSLGSNPGIPLPNGQVIDLAFDVLLLQSLATPSAVGLRNSNSKLDPAGNGVASLRLGWLGAPLTVYVSCLVLGGPVSETEVFRLR